MNSKSPGIVNVRVIKHLPMGLSVESHDGQRGIVRLREISWSRERLREWMSYYPVGWNGAAMQIPAKKDRSRKDRLLEFSLRLAESDPWENLPEYLEKGKVFDGVVTSVVGYGAFVEIAPGLTGLLHWSRLPQWCKKSPSDVFWPRDRALVVIRDVDREQRHIGLDLAVVHQSANDESLVSANVGARKAWNADAEFEKLLSDGTIKKHILVVEDDKLQSAAVCNWLRSFGQSVDAADCAQKALDLLNISQPDIVFVDVGLPDMSGLDLVSQILDHWPRVMAVNTTDWASANEMLDKLETLQKRGAKLLLKPLLPEDLLNFLLYESQVEIENKSQAEETAHPPESTFANISSVNDRKFIKTLLRRCRKHLEFELAVLFSFDPAHRLVAIVETSGDVSLNRGAIPSLIYSPVRDVAEDGDIISINDISIRESDRFRYLLELYPGAVSCIATPTPTHGSLKYALFILDKRARQISAEQKTYAEGVALALGASLDQDGFREKSILMQRAALIGHLTRAMMHEINNIVSPLLYDADRLKTILSGRNGKEHDDNGASLNKSVVEIQQNVRKIANTTKIFGRIVAKGKNEVLKIDEIIHETIALLRDVSDRAHVDVYFAPPEKLVAARGQSVILEQVFLNVMLNAIQQIESIRPDRGGWVKIKMELASDSSRNPICRILIEDNGPGIHFSLWEKVFDIGFTTRYDGSGIGLYVSRSLMEDIGGKIYVSRSHVLGGSTLALEIPVHI